MANYKVLEGEVVGIGTWETQNCFELECGDTDSWFGESQTEVIWYDVKPYPHHLPSNLVIGDKVRAVVKRTGVVSYTLISINVEDR